MNEPTPARSVYVLSHVHAFATELAQRLDGAGFQVESVDNVDEYAELVLGLSPHALLVDASCAAALPEVGRIREQAQQRLRDRPGGIPLLVLLPEDTMRARLDARRAGAGALLFPPFTTQQIVRQLKELLAPASVDSERVLIVEDDRAQALFAQSVLNNAGMQAEVEQNPLHVMEALEFLRPELVLMDLHMPDANGVELTALIREHPQFRSTPIVFLSGESDPEARFDAIDAGGDDFLAKPIRPKHLIATVRNRVRRMREIETPAPVSERDAETGLYRRQVVEERIRAALAAAERGPGGVLFVRIIDASALRERIGLAALERVARAAGKSLAAELAPDQAAAGINDNAFLVLAPGLDDAALDALALRLREVLMAATFDAGGMALQLRVAVGVAGLQGGAADEHGLFDLVERTARQARDLPDGVKRHVSRDVAQRQREDAESAWLRDAIGQDRIELALQPIVAVKGGVEAQFQSLLRLRDGDGRLRSAAEILPIAARSHLQVELDRCVLNRALALIRRQQDLWKPIRLFVPQSLATLSTPDQMDWIKQAVARHGGIGSGLVLQCRVEDVLLNPSVVAALAAGVRKSGVRIALSRYEHAGPAERLLEAHPPAFLKLAPAYVAARATPEERAQAQQAIDLAHRLGVKVVATCVEEAQVAAWLWTSGIDFVQGYLVAPPGDSLDFDFVSGMH